jgi:hypothetical protein
MSDEVTRKLTAYRSDEEPWRIERLNEVAKECPPNVIGLHDHKGTLSVNWSSTPTIAELTAVVQAWCDQNEYSIDHWLNAAPLEVETMGYDPFEAKAVA